MDEDVYSPKVDTFDQTPSGDENSVGFGTHLIDFIQTFVVFGAIFAIIYLFVAQPHKVSGSSMLPNFQDGNYILTDKLSYRFSKPEKGDVIVLKNPRDESQDFIKRIIALPGDNLELQDGSVFLNGKKLDEQYLPKDIFTKGGNFLSDGQTITIATNTYFVFGDNRNHSSDSREIGPIKKDEIIGKVIFRYWPPDRFGIIRSPSS